MQLRIFCIFIKIYRNIFQAFLNLVLFDPYTDWNIPIFVNIRKIVSIKYFYLFLNLVRCGQSYIFLIYQEVFSSPLNFTKFLVNNRALCHIQCYISFIIPLLADCSGPFINMLLALKFIFRLQNILYLTRYIYLNHIAYIYLNCAVYTHLNCTVW